MKKHGRWEKRVELVKTVVCAALIIASIVIGVVMVQLGDDPTRDPFSAIGVQNRALFVLWGVTTALAVWLNLRILASRLNYKNKFFEIVLIIGCSMAIVTTSVVGMDVARRVIHITSAGIFGLVCTLCVVWLLWVKLKRKNKRSSAPYITAIALAGIIFIITTIFVGWFTAQTQILLANVCLITMFLSNYIEKWSVPN